MHVCGYVHERCCSLYDEVKISHMWRNRSFAMLQRYKDRSIFYYKNAIEQFDKMMKIDPMDVMVKYSVVRELAY